MLDEHRAPDIVGGCYVEGQVYDQEGCGITFINFISEKISNGFYIEGSDGDSMVNVIGC